MYAVIKSGGKQYKVKAGDLLKVEKIEKNLGEEFACEQVLFVGGSTSFAGEPTVSNAKVTLVVTQQSKFPKVLVFKKKRRQGFRKMKGHRQPFTEVFVKSITTPDGKVENASGQAPIKDSSKKKSEEGTPKKVAKASGEKKTAIKAKAEAKPKAKKVAAKSTAAKTKTVKKTTK